MREFLEELADLLEVHGIEMEAVDDDERYYPSVSGVEFAHKSEWDVGRYKSGIYVDAKSIREELNR